MFQEDQDYIITTGSSHTLSFVVNGKLIESLYHPGPCDSDVDAALSLPEIKEQTDGIPDDALDLWWGEFFCDDTEEEHTAATRQRKLAWALFDAAANAIDGDYLLLEQPSV